MMRGSDKATSVMPATSGVRQDTVWTDRSSDWIARDDAGDAGADAVVGRLLALNDPVGGVAHGAVDLRVDAVGQRGAGLGGEAAHRQPANLGAGPVQHLAVPMLAEYLGVDRGRRHPKWRASRERNRAVSRIVPDPMTRPGVKPEILSATWVITSTGLVAINRIALGAAASTRGMMSANTSAFRSRSWIRVSPGRWPTPADRITIFRIRDGVIVAGTHHRWVGERRGMDDVLGLRLRQRGVAVDQNDLAGDAAQHDGIGGGAADKPGTDDRNLHGRISRSVVALLSLQMDAPSANASNKRQIETEFNGNLTHLTQRLHCSSIGSALSNLGQGAMDPGGNHVGSDQGGDVQRVDEPGD